jgi:hypothetical protein
VLPVWPNDPVYGQEFYHTVATFFRPALLPLVFLPPHTQPCGFSHDRATTTAFVRMTLPPPPLPATSPCPLALSPNTLTAPCNPSHQKLTRNILLHPKNALTLSPAMTTCACGLWHLLRGHTRHLTNVDVNAMSLALQDTTSRIQAT